jgi:hypothetical protein
VLADYANVVGPQHSNAVHNWHDLVRKIERGEPEIQLVADPPSRSRARIVVAIGFAAAAAIALLWFGGKATVAALAIDDRPSAASWQGGSIVDTQEPAAVVDHVVVVDDDARPRPRASAPTTNAAEPAAPPAVVPPPPPAPAASKSKASSKPAANKPSVSPSVTPEDAASALDQVKVIGKAYAALRDGDGARALHVLDGHAKRWPTSEFAAERDLLRVRALCLAGRKSDAENAAASFKRKHPGSPHGAALKHCAGNEPTR